MLSVELWKANNMGPEEPAPFNGLDTLPGYPRRTMIHKRNIQIREAEGGYIINVQAEGYYPPNNEQVAATIEDVLKIIKVTLETKESASVSAATIGYSHTAASLQGVYPNAGLSAGEVSDHN